MITAKKRRPRAKYTYLVTITKHEEETSKDQLDDLRQTLRDRYSCFGQRTSVRLYRVPKK